MTKARTREEGLEVEWRLIVALREAAPTGVGIVHKGGYAAFLETGKRERATWCRTVVAVHSVFAPYLNLHREEFLTQCGFNAHEISAYTAKNLQSERKQGTIE